MHSVFFFAHEGLGLKVQTAVTNENLTDSLID